MKKNLALLLALVLMIASVYGAGVSIKVFSNTTSSVLDENLNTENNRLMLVNHHDDIEVSDDSSDSSSGYNTVVTSTDNSTETIFEQNGSDVNTKFVAGSNELYDYTIDEEGTSITITKYKGNEAQVSIPSTIDGYSVVSIGESAFAKNETLQKVTIPNTVTYLGARAFSECSNLQEAVLSENITRLDHGVFRYCVNLHKVNIPLNVKTDSLTAEIVYSGPFAGCTNLTEVEFADGTTEISQGLFSQSGLTEIVLPQTLTSINDRAFYKCDKLSNVTFNDSLDIIGVYAFAECGLLQEVSLPDSVTKLDIGAFKDCVSLNKVYIPKDVHTNTLADEFSGPFNGCTNLTEVNFAQGTTYIGVALLSETGIREIELPQRLTSIDEKAFYGCDKLSKVTFNNSLDYIDRYAFAECGAIQELNLPNSITKLDVGAFRNCTNLHKVNIPKNVQAVISLTPIDGSYHGAFSGCANLTEVNFAEGTTIIDDGLLAETGIREIELPQELNSIGDRAFSGSSLENIVIPNSVTEMKDYIFANCDKLQTITLPDTITNISKSTFAGCTSMEEISLPDTVTTIKPYAFANCTSLKRINWSKSIKEIQEHAFENCDGLVEIELPNSITSIGNDLFADCDLLKTVRLGTQINVIPSQMFMHCDVLNKVELPLSVKSIEKDAFKDCIALSEITIPQATTNIQSESFSYYDILTIYGVEGSYAETFAKENNAKFEAVNIAANKITLNKEALIINREDKERLYITVEPYNCTDLMTWESSNNDIVEVDEYGVLTAKEVGEATIKVSVGDKSQSCNVTVVAPVKYIFLNKSEVEISGTSYQLKATISPSDATNKKLEWSSSDENIAKVDSNGLITAISKGEATITVKACDGSGVYKTCKVTVLHDIILVSDITKFESKHNYENNTSQLYVYHVNGATSLDIEFDKRTSVENGLDFIKILDGNGEEFHVFTGNDGANYKYNVPGNTVMIVITSDDAGTDWGFKIANIKAHIFKDVPLNAWFTLVVEKAYTKNLMGSTGKGKEYFEPDAPITRGMVATVLYRMAGKPKVTFTTKFPDVKDKLWYSQAIIWANQAGIVKGYDTGKFGPDDKITRQDLAIMLRNYAVNIGKLKANEKADLNTFKDVKSVSPYAVPSLQWIVANKIISGKENGTKVAPIDNATRAECAKMFTMLQDLIEK